MDLFLYLQQQQQKNVSTLNERCGAVDISFRTATPLQIQQHTEIEYTLTRE